MRAMTYRGPSGCASRTTGARDSASRRRDHSRHARGICGSTFTCITVSCPTCASVKRSDTSLSAWRGGRTERAEREAGDKVLVRQCLRTCTSAHADSTAIVTTQSERDRGRGIYGYSHTCGGGAAGGRIRAGALRNFGPTLISPTSTRRRLMLTDACPTGYQAAQMADINEGDSVLIFGAGPVGIFAARSEWLMGRDAWWSRSPRLPPRLVRKWGPADGELLRPQGSGRLTSRRSATHRFRPPPSMRSAATRPGHAAGAGRISVESAGRQRGRSALGRQLGAQRRHGGHHRGVWSADESRSPRQHLQQRLTIHANQAAVKRQLPRLFEHSARGGSSRARHHAPFRLEEIADAYRVFTSKLDGCIKRS